MVLPPYIRELAPYLEIEIGHICRISISCKVDSDWNLRPACYIIMWRTLHEARLCSTIPWDSISRRHGGVLHPATGILGMADMHAGWNWAREDHTSVYTIKTRNAARSQQYSALPSLALLPVRYAVVLRCI